MGFLTEDCEDLLYQLVCRFAAMGELFREIVFIDGTKLKACANKYTFVWRKAVGKWEEKMFANIEEAVCLVNREYIKSFSVTKENLPDDLRRIVDFLKQYCREHKLAFVHGRGKRKITLQCYQELFRRFLDCQLLYDLHMRDAQLKSGYNIQIGVDSEYVVGTDIFLEIVVLLRTGTTCGRWSCFCSVWQKIWDSFIRTSSRMPDTKARRHINIWNSRNRFLYQTADIREMEKTQFQTGGYQQEREHGL